MTYYTVMLVTGFFCGWMANYVRLRRRPASRRDWLLKQARRASMRADRLTLKAAGASGGAGTGMLLRAERLYAWAGSARKAAAGDVDEAAGALSVAEGGK